MKRLTIALICLFLCIPSQARIITVDDDGPADFNNIQAAINDANVGDIVEVQPGIYTGEGNRDIDFLGKAITVKSENGPQNCIIDCNGTYAENYRGFYFVNNEGQDSVLEGFTITNAYVSVMCEAGAGIYINGASPTISKCIVTNNYARLEPGAMCFCLGGGIYIGNESGPLITDCVISENSLGDWGWGGGLYCDYETNATIQNCVISNNTTLGERGAGGGINCQTYSDLTVINCTITGNLAAEEGGGIYLHAYQESPIRTVTNSIIRNNLPEQLYTPDTDTVQVLFSNVQGGWPGAGNIDTDPCFADPSSGDYHLKSQAGRWDPSNESWVIDGVTSLAIDAGNPADPVGYEPFPNGGIVNMGAYGGTGEASKSYFGTTPCETIVAGDINGDCKVDFLDFAFITFHWLEDNSP